MRQQRTRTVLLLLSVLSVSSVLPGRADTWVTVNPDGSVTRTTVTTSSGPATNVPAANVPATNRSATTTSRSSVSTYGYSVNPYPSTGYAYPGQYPQPYYPQPYYPPAPTTNYNQYYYYPPAQPYSGPLHPVPSYANPPWITSIPLGNGYGYGYYPSYPSGYDPHCQPCTVCRCYPCRCYSRGTSSSFSIGPGGVSITINSRRPRTSITHSRR